MTERDYAEWTPVFSSSTDYEADIVRDRLDDAGIPAVVLTQRDHAFNLTVGTLAAVQVLVPPDHVNDAMALLEAPAISDHDLDQEAMESDPLAASAHDPEREAMLDSGIEKIRLSPPDEVADDDDDDDILP